MRGWVFHSRGLPSQVLRLENDLPQPSPASLGPHDVLIQVKYAALSQGSAVLISQIPHFNNNPWIAENNFSGIVTAVGNQVEHVKVGDEVFGGFGPDVFVKHGGVLAEYVVLPDYVVVGKPGNISLEGAAGMGAGGVTALQFMDVVKARRGSRVLVIGASGGTGTLVVQAAKATVGVEGVVVGVCSGANEQLVKNLGADEVIDYTQHPVLHEYLAEKYSSDPFDAIIDIVGADPLLYQKSPAYLTPDGVFLFAGNMPLMHGGGNALQIICWILGIAIAKRRPVILGGVPRNCAFHSGRVGKEALQTLAHFIAEGKMRPVIDSVYEMDEVLLGYTRLATSRARGRVVVRVQD